ncbi:MAG: hypothetical protein JXQ96_21620 [Cyclobacteriaceae bacterium]
MTKHVSSILTLVLLLIQFYCTKKIEHQVLKPDSKEEILVRFKEPSIQDKNFSIAERDVFVDFAEDITFKQVSVDNELLTWEAEKLRTNPSAERDY